MKWLVVLLVAIPISALAAKAPFCQNGMTSPRVRAYMGLIRKALADGVLASPDVNRLLSLEHVESPLRVTNDDPLNTSLKTGFQQIVPNLTNVESQAIHAELATLAVELTNIDSTTAVARQATAGAVAPALVFKTAWPGEYKVSYPVFYQHDSAGRDRWIVINRKTMELKAFELGKGTTPTFTDAYLSKGEWGSWFHLFDSHHSANGHFYLTYPSMNEKKLCLYDLDGTGTRLTASIDSAPTRLQIVEGKNGRLLITAVFPNATRVYERSGTGLKMIAEIPRPLEPNSVFGFFNPQGEFTVFGHDLASKSVILVNTTKAVSALEGEWPIDKKLDNYYPFVDSSGHFGAALPYYVNEKPSGIYFVRPRDKKLSRVTGWKFPANNSQGSWQQLSDGRVVFAIIGLRLPGNTFSSDGYSFFEPFGPTPLKPRSTMFVTSMPFRLRWTRLADGTDVAAMLSWGKIDLLRAADLSQLRDGSFPIHGSGSSPGFYSQPDTNGLYLGGLFDNRLIIHDLLGPLTRPLFSGPKIEERAASTEWQTLANGDVAAGVVAEENGQVIFEIYRLVNGNPGAASMCEGCDP